MALFLDGNITGNHLQLSYNPKPKYRIKSQKLQIHKAFNIKDLKNMQKTQTFYISVHRSVSGMDKNMASPDARYY